jgi:DNA polymerase III epsilon subunit-like protein
MNTDKSTAAYVILDTETGGLDPRIHALTQVSFIITDLALNELDTFAHRIIPRPGFTVDPFAAKINGYDEAEWLRTGMEWEQADRAYSQYIQQWFGTRKAVAVAHNAPFDDKFVRTHLPSVSPLFLDPWFCTLSALKRWRSTTKIEGKNKLSDLAELAQFKHAAGDKAHDALGDTKTCLAGLRWLKTQNAAFG